MKIGIVRYAETISHNVVSQRIARVFAARGHRCQIYDYRDRVKEKHVLFVGTVFAENLSYLTKFLPEKKIVFYGTVEGFPFIDPAGVEKKVAENISIVVPSHFVKTCLETVGIPVAGIVPHGIDMRMRHYDEEYYEYLREYIKGPTVLYVAGNTARKGIDRFVVAAKLVQREIPETHFILHSGIGFINVPEMVREHLELKNFWFTNTFGMLPLTKINSLYKICTVYCQASYCEGFGLGMIEAFRWNAPVVATDVEPYNEIVQNGKTGVLIQCRKVVQHKYLDRFLLPLHIYSVDDLADAVISLLKKEEIRKQMAHNILQGKERFEASRTYAKLLGFF